MFSGLIHHLGRIVSVRGSLADGITLVVEAPDAVRDGVALGDSIAVNGVCLTVVAADATTFSFDVVPESIRRAGFNTLAPGDPVNVELSLRLGDRLGGHLVYGHVDANATIIAKVPEGQGHRLSIGRPPELAAYIVEKGYVTVDGVSLTVAAVHDGRFEIALIPETSRRTTLGTKVAGAHVNLEIDPVARYALGAVAAYRDAARPATTADELAWAYEI
jgi:riboflavin synthase